MLCIYTISIQWNFNNKDNRTRGTHSLGMLNNVFVSNYMRLCKQFQISWDKTAGQKDL